MNEESKTIKSNVSRKYRLNDSDLREHLIAIGKRIIGDAETMKFPANNTLRSTITASIEPGVAVTVVQYTIERIADPRIHTRENDEDEVEE